MVGSASGVTTQDVEITQTEFSNAPKGLKVIEYRAPNGNETDGNVLVHSALKGCRFWYRQGPQHYRHRVRQRSPCCLPAVLARAESRSTRRRAGGRPRRSFRAAGR
ncbi:hypothetical protein GCM10022233_11440 [Streptomyces shaanxiensis]|uniref:Uncharacterized protein n=1 Tax=Streptomyces shaanxiensis TaxID=653357 RepID=A0ABP7UIZ0_9ACTN